MKKYTQPTVEITAFDFEDITMSADLGLGVNTATLNSFKDAVAYDNANGGAGNLNVVQW